MPDTVRTKSYLTASVFQDGQAPGSITEQDERDFVVSVDSWVGPAYQTLTSSAGATTWATAGEKVNNAKITLTENTTLTITGAVEGASGWLEITEDATGLWTLTLPTGVIVGATSNINTAANKRSALLWTYNGAAFWFILAQET